MASIPDAPWIRETEATGHCSDGYWNQPPKECNDDDEFIYTVYMDDDEEDDFEGSDGDVFYGNETNSF